MCRRNPFSVGIFSANFLSCAIILHTLPLVLAVFPGQPCDCRASLSAFWMTCQAGAREASCQCWLPAAASPSVDPLITQRNPPLSPCWEGQLCVVQGKTLLLCRCKDVSLWRQEVVCVGTQNSPTVERHFRAAALPWATVVLAWAGWSTQISAFLPLVTFTTQMNLLHFRKLQEVVKTV